VWPFHIFDNPILDECVPIFRFAIFRIEVVTCQDREERVLMFSRLDLGVRGKRIRVSRIPEST
jgi:hypothetical protein